MRATIHRCSFRPAMRHLGVSDSIRSKPRIAQHPLEEQLQQSNVTLRPEPLLDFPVQKTFHVKEFGAVAGVGKCSTRAIQAAIDAAIHSGVPSRLEFDPGVYRIDVSERRIALTIENASDLIIDGKGCEFHITEPTKEFLAVEGSHRVAVKNLAVDFEAHSGVGDRGRCRGG